MILPTHSFRNLTDFDLKVSAQGRELFQRDGQGLCTIEVAGCQYTVNFEAKTVCAGWRQKLKRFFSHSGPRVPTAQEIEQTLFPDKDGVQHLTEPEFAQWVVDRQQWRAEGGLEATLEMQGELAPFERLGNGAYGMVDSVFIGPAGPMMARKIPKRLNKPLHGELGIINQLKHPNVIQCWPTLNNDHAMVMENGGIPLYDLCNTPMLGLSRNQFLCCCEQLLMALTYLHNLNIVHRDIKPDNLLINPNTGHLRITDFGLAEDLGEAGFSQLGHCSPAYAAPEVRERQAYRMSPDIYSAGCTLYEMYSGRRFRHSAEPYPTNTEQIKACMAAGVIARAAPAFSPNEHELFVGLLIDMLAYDPSQRITAKQALAKLRTLFRSREV